MPPAAVRMPPATRSHKKKRKLAADIKIENASAKRKLVQARKSPRPSASSRPVPSVDAIVSVDKTVSASTLTPTRLKQNDRFYKISAF